jgi:putative spermidine/putrescine transport system permease protein
VIAAFADRLARALAVGAAGLAVLAMLGPVLLTVVISFSGDSFYDFPPSSWSLRHYREAFADPLWGSALGLSFEVAIAVAVLSAAVAVPTAFAVHRSRLPGRHAVYVAGLSGIIVPITALAVALYGVFSALGLRGSYIGLVLANTTLAAPVMLIVVTAAMSRIPVSLELAAMVAGAGKARAWIGITGRLLVPAVLAGGLLAFVTSFDEAVLISFLGGPEQTTLPRAVLDSARFGLSPVVTAIATLLMAGATVLAIAALRVIGSERD